ncbi:hypothetical protein V1515DRAFT_636836 [Lipomyces mesembrius]
MHFILRFIVHANGPYSVVAARSRCPLTPTDERLDSGVIWVTDEQCIVRSFSATISKRDQHFREKLRNRDRKSVITGLINPAAHRDSQYITNRSEETRTGINSCQNGLLMQSGVGKQFDSTLDPVCWDPGDDDGAVDEFLRWHFRQAVLANMKGSGEPIFESDFPDGSDMVGEILSGPRASERMEAELYSRLNSVPRIF